MEGYRRTREPKRCRERKHKSKKETDSTLWRKEMRKGVFSYKGDKNDNSNNTYIIATNPQIYFITVFIYLITVLTYE